MRVGLDVSADGRKLVRRPRPRRRDAAHRRPRPGRRRDGRVPPGGRQGRVRRDGHRRPRRAALPRRRRTSKQNVLDTRPPRGGPHRRARAHRGLGGRRGVRRAGARRPRAGPPRDAGRDDGRGGLGRHGDHAAHEEARGAPRRGADLLAQKRRDAAQASAALALPDAGEGRGAPARERRGARGGRRRAPRAPGTTRRRARRRGEAATRPSARCGPSRRRLRSSRTWRSANVDRLREERGTRPQALDAARAALESSLRAAARDAADHARRFGAVSRLEDEPRARLEAAPALPRRPAEGARRRRAGARGAVGRPARGRPRRGARAAGRGSGRGTGVRPRRRGGARGARARGCEAGPQGRRRLRARRDRRGRARPARAARPRDGHRRERARAGRRVVRVAVGGRSVLHDRLARGVRAHARTPRRDRLGPGDAPSRRGRGGFP